MKRILLVFFVAVCFSANAHAQEIHLETPIRLHPVNEQPTSEPAVNDSDELPIIHVTDDLMRSPEGQRALEEYRERLQAPNIFPRQAAQPEVGDTVAYQVINLQTRTFYSQEFILKVKQTRFNVWVSTTALDSNFVRQLDIDSLAAALGERTPEESYNSDAGIIENDEVVFGQPPDIDGNGKSTVLLFNIRDGWEPDAGYVAGYVSSGQNNQNNADMLSLDVLPGIYVPDDVDFPTQSGGYQDVSNVSATAAHEYQHLIMIRYDGNEITFVNEGLSEYAEIINGYPIRTPSYLLDPVRYNVDLFEWRAGGNQLLDDYQRAGAFTNYLGDQIGILETGLLTRLASDGEAAYNEALNQAGASRDFDDILFDFHTANLIQDTTLNQRFGYTTRGRANLGAVPKVVYDGRLNSSTSLTSDTLEAGGALFYRWENVEDFQITIDVIQESLRARLHLRAILEDTTGAVSFRDFEPSDQPEIFSGAFQQVSLVTVDVAAGAFPDEVPFEYEASWTAPEIELSSNTVAYDNGQIGQKNGTALIVPIESNDGANVVATKFDVPNDDVQATRLDKVFLPVYYFSQLGNAPQDAPRDFELTVWDVDADGKPGDTLFSQAYNDPRPFDSSVEFALDFAEIDLSSFSDELSSLPDSIYIGYRGVGIDDNFLYGIFSPMTDTSQNQSQITLGGEFTDVWDVNLIGGGDTISLNHTVVPIRAQFLYPTNVDVEQTPTLPTSITLHQNYPNPFTTSTTIEYALPRPADVRLEVYDVLGRRVATLVDERLAAGTYETSVDMSGRASGLYIYRLEAGDRILTRKMLHIK